MAGPLLALLAVLTALVAPPSVAQERSGSACAAIGRSEASIVSVGPRGDLLLDNGERARLDGLRWPDDPVVAGEATAWLEARRGGRLAVDWRGATDRWQRRAANALAGAESEAPVDLAIGLLAAGLALVDVGESEALCRPALLIAEAEARAAGRGLWAREAVIGSHEAARLSAAAGRFVVAEGRIRSVGERRAWTYLNFAAPGVDSLTVTIARRTWRILADRGVSAAALRGRRVRARGIVEIRRGPTLELTAADMLEVLDETGARRRTP